MTITVRPHQPNGEALARYIRGLILTGRKHEAARLLRIGFDVEPLTIYRVVNRQASVEFRFGLLHIATQEETSDERSV